MDAPQELGRAAGPGAPGCAGCGRPFVRMARDPRRALCYDCLPRAADNQPPRPPLFTLLEDGGGERPAAAAGGTGRRRNRRRSVE